VERTKIDLGATDYNFSPGGKDIFDYLAEYHVLDYYNLENSQELNAVCKDFNEYAGTRCSNEEFLQAAKYYQDVHLFPRFSFFRKPISNIHPYKTISLKQLYDVVVEPKYYLSVTEKLRGIEDGAEAKTFKARHFDYATFSGVFSKRISSCLLTHSGLMVIDIDKIHEVELTRSTLLDDDQIPTEMLFVSPSGKGLKWIIKSFPEKYEHGYFFTAVSTYLKERYGIENDPSGKDIGRACFVCHDPYAYINPKYL
jgi:hypothetical protein